MKIRIGSGFWSSRLGMGVLISALALLLVSASVVTFYYIRYSRMIDARLSGQVYQNTSRIFTAPRRIFTGQPLTPSSLAGYLRAAGYTESSGGDQVGRFDVSGNVVEIRPGPSSYFAGEKGFRVEFAGNSIGKILTLPARQPLASIEIEPELLTNLFDSAREKRRLVRFDDLPKHLVDAVLSAEDKRFFEHAGLDPIRVIGAAWADVKSGELEQGASTITMQVARSFFFSPRREWRRKLAETMVALQLEQRFGKKEIFELYANQIYLGNRGSFAIHGFGEAARAYFGKDVHDISLGEAAFLAGIIRAPNRYSSAERRPERIAEARDRVLTQMVSNKLITTASADAAKKVSVRLVTGALEPSAAPYFVDMVKDSLLDRHSEEELNSSSFRIYSTLDPDLQRAAAVSLSEGIVGVDKLLAKKYELWRRELAKKKSKDPAPRVQAAMVVLDPATGEIKALIGGRDYGQSQLNRALALRQPGSVFKPFVYAAAFSNAVDGVAPILTPATTVVDEPTTFLFGDTEYTPNNFGEQFGGVVTLRDALARSLNVATVKVAEMIGYNRVVEISRRMGLAARIQATPAVALGAYDMTPIEVAAGYTVFATGGRRAEPFFLRSVVGADGRTLQRNIPRLMPALDPRVSYIVTNMMEDVINRGTGAGVRARGFTAPAAGKTGTSRDGWFAGFTSNLLCIVWVGFDDGRDLGLAGSAAAGPIWAEFMKRVVALPAYSNTQPFFPPAGVVTVTIDADSGLLASPDCPRQRPEVFVVGTAPTDFCPPGGRRSITISSSPMNEFALPPASRSATTASFSPPSKSRPGAPKTGPRPALQPPASTPAEKKKKGLFGKIFGIFKDKKN